MIGIASTVESLTSKINEIDPLPERFIGLFSGNNRLATFSRFFGPLDEIFLS
jgi:hypothetical protein